MRAAVEERLARIAGADARFRAEIVARVAAHISEIEQRIAALEETFRTSDANLFEEFSFCAQSNICARLDAILECARAAQRERALWRSARGRLLALCKRCAAASAVE